MSRDIGVFSVRWLKRVQLDHCSSHTPVVPQNVKHKVYTICCRAFKMHLLCDSLTMGSYSTCGRPWSIDWCGANLNPLNHKHKNFFKSQWIKFKLSQTRRQEGTLQVSIENYCTKPRQHRQQSQFEIWSIEWVMTVGLFHAVRLTTGSGPAQSPL